MGTSWDAVLKHQLPCGSGQLQLTCNCNQRYDGVIRILMLSLTMEEEDEGGNKKRYVYYSNWNTGISPQSPPPPPPTTLILSPHHLPNHTCEWQSPSKSWYNTKYGAAFPNAFGLHTCLRAVRRLANRVKCRCR